GRAVDVRGGLGAATDRTLCVREEQSGLLRRSLLHAGRTGVGCHRAGAADAFAAAAVARAGGTGSTGRALSPAAAPRGRGGSLLLSHILAAARRCGCR